MFIIRIVKQKLNCTFIVFVTFLWIKTIKKWPVLMIYESQKNQVQSRFSLSGTVPFSIKFFQCLIFGVAFLTNQYFDILFNIH